MSQQSTAQKNNANFIWSIADLLRGPYKPHQYGAIVLPFTILRRMDCVLEPTSRRCSTRHSHSATRHRHPFS